MPESLSRIEPTRLEDAPGEVADLVVALASAGAALAKALHPRTAASLASLVRLMNTYYTNLIEGHETRPRDIARALAGDLDANTQRRNLQLEAAAHVRVQAEVDAQALEGTLPEPASREFVRWLHREFYRDAPEAVLRVSGPGGELRMQPGMWRGRPEHDVAVGRHLPPSSERVDDFMRFFEVRYRFADMGPASRVMAMAASHHRFNYIHPFPDGNGRVSRLMSHAMAHAAGIGAHGLWSVSRGLARGLESRAEYKQMLDSADSPREGPLDGRGNLSLRALTEFTVWFLRVCLDQVRFMSGLLDLDHVSRRLEDYARESPRLRPESAKLVVEALRRGQFERGEASRITGLPDRTARRVLSDLTGEGLLASETPKGPVSLRFPIGALEALFPALYREA